VTQEILLLYDNQAQICSLNQPVMNNGGETKKQQPGPLKGF